MAPRGLQVSGALLPREGRPNDENNGSVAHTLSEHGRFADDAGHRARDFDEPAARGRAAQLDLDGNALFIRGSGYTLNGAFQHVAIAFLLPRDITASDTAPEVGALACLYACLAGQAIAPVPKCLSQGLLDIRDRTVGARESVRFDYLHVEHDVRGFTQPVVTAEQLLDQL